jgi:hypothetical protein
VSQFSHPAQLKLKLSHFTPRRSLGQRSIASTYFDLGTRWGWMAIVTPQPLFRPGEGPPVPIAQQAGWVPEPESCTVTCDKYRKYNSQLETIQQVTSACIVLARKINTNSYYNIPKQLYQNVQLVRQTVSAVVPLSISIRQQGHRTVLRQERSSHTTEQYHTWGQGKENYILHWRLRTKNNFSRRNS